MTAIQKALAAVCRWYDAVDMEDSEPVLKAGNYELVFAEQNHWPRKCLNRSDLKKRMDQIEVERAFGRREKDDPGTVDPSAPESEFVRTPPVQMTGQKRGKKMKAKKVVRKILESVAKAGGGMTRQQIEREAMAGAEVIAKQDGITVAQAEAKIWNK